LHFRQAFCVSLEEHPARNVSFSPSRFDSRRGNSLIALLKWCFVRPRFFYVLIASTVTMLRKKCPLCH